MAATPKESKKQPTGDYETGYCRPPVHSRVQKGQVLNPHGRNGSPIDGLDAFEKARRRLSRVTIDGETAMIPSDEAFYLLQMTKAMAGDKSAARIIAQELAARRNLTPPGPPEPTAEQLDAQEQLKQTMIEALELIASEKRRNGPPCVRFGPDGRPIGTYDPF